MAAGPKRGLRDAPTLFERAASESGRESMPLAERMRPERLSELVGQSSTVGQGRPLERLIAEDRVPSLIVWGPPGTGKTTLARIVANHTKARFAQLSAVLDTVKDVREVIAEAKEARAYRAERTIVFIDEIHRFNRAQQDALLPHVEAGTVTLIGATTENPSFSVNGALLSRCRTVRLEPLDVEQVRRIVDRALDSDPWLSGLSPEVSDDVRDALARASGGDARKALNLLEAAARSIEHADVRVIDIDLLEALGQGGSLLYDRSGEEHYNVASAFIKSLRGSDPDAALYYMMRMLEAGEDPLFVSRRMLVFASEDIGLADSRAIVIAEAADATFRRLGMPEGLYTLSHAALYLACAPKSNSVGKAWQAARSAVREHGALPVPLRLRNAVTRDMKNEGYGSGYRYPHDEREAVARGEAYLPTALAGTRYYAPTRFGEESRIAARLEAIRGEGDS